MDIRLLKVYLCSSYNLNPYVNGTVINAYMLRYAWNWDKIECRLFHQYKNVPIVYINHFKYKENRKIIHVKFHFSKTEDNIIVTTTTFDLYISHKKFKKFCRNYENKRIY